MRTLIVLLATAAAALPAVAQDGAGDDWDLHQDPARGLTLATLEFEGAPTLAVRCLNGDLAVIVAQLPAPLPGGNAMDVTVSARSAGLSWRPVGDAHTAQHAAPDIAARDMRRGGAVTIRAPGDDGRLRRYELSVPTESANVARVLETCGRAISDPRDDLPRLDPRAVTWTGRGEAVFPQSAADKGIRAGEVILSCRVNGMGGLDDCRVESETPPDAGFADAASGIWSTGRLALPDGSSPDGSLIILKTRFRVE